MPVTLEEARNNVQDDVQAGIIDEFRKSSYLLEAITFDDVVSPGTGQSTLTYGYTRLLTQPGAQFRAVNTEYTPAEVMRQRITVDLAIFGGSYEIDRVIADNISALISEVNLQATQKVKAARSLFHDTVINGSVAQSAIAFDGLDVAVAGSTTEYRATETTDISGELTPAQAFTFMDALDDFLSTLDEKPQALASNSKLINKIKGVARRAGYITESEDAFGNKVTGYDGITLVDLGDKPSSNLPVVPIRAADVGGAAQTGLADLYAMRFGLDAFHGLSPAGRELVRQWLPDYTTAGAVKRGEVELVAAVALKASKSAGVYRNIKVQG